MRLLMSFCSPQRQNSTLKQWLVWLLIGSCLLTIGNDRQRQPLLVCGVMIPVPSAALAVTAVKTSREVVSWVIDTWGLFEGTEIHPIFKSREQLILERLTHLNSRIEASEREILSTAISTARNLLREFALDKDIRNKLDRLLELMNQVVKRDHKMRSYLASDEKLEQLTLEEFARSAVVEGENSLEELLTKIDWLIVGSEGSAIHKIGLLEELQLASEKIKSIICGFNLSVQQMIHHLYNAAVITELKSYSMMQFSWMLLKAYGKGNFTAEAKLMHQRFEQRTNHALNEFQRIMAQASREYWRCDPERIEQKEGEAFLQITRLLQGYVVNEVDLNTRNTCKENCGHYNWGVVQEQCYDNRYCPRQSRCSGKIYDCEYLGNDMGACLPGARNARRYEFIEYKNGMVLGQKKNCPKSSVNSWWRIFYHCSYCFCMCDDDGPSSDRYINLRESVSDVSKNKVVTGLRFIKKKRVIYLIVQQGELLPRGQINNATLEWIEPQAYDILSKKVKSGRDFATLTRLNRTMDLDDIVLQPFYVLTGVRFRRLDTHINLEARMTQMDFGTGKLINLNNSIWVGNNNTEQDRTELKLDRPHIPTLSPLPSVPGSSSNQYIQFVASDREKDAAQTTVPFFDAQPVVPVKETPLGGCGIFYKGQNGFGGFLAPKVFTYDYSLHVQPLEVKDNAEFDSFVKSNTKM